MLDKSDRAAYAGIKSKETAVLGSLFTLARSLYMLFQGTDQLIGAGGRFIATADALQAGDDFFQLHAFDQFGYGLEIAGTAAGEGYLAEPVVLNVEGDSRGANAGGLISEHNEKSFLLGNDVSWRLLAGHGDAASAGTAGETYRFILTLRRYSRNRVK